MNAKDNILHMILHVIQHGIDRCMTFKETIIPRVYYNYLFMHHYFQFNAHFVDVEQSDSNTRK